MDPLDFARETLRLHLLECAEVLAKTAEGYRPEEEIPILDTLAVQILHDRLIDLVNKYIKEIAVHVAHKTINPNSKSKMSELVELMEARIARRNQETTH